MPTVDQGELTDSMNSLDPVNVTHSDAPIQGYKAQLRDYFNGVGFARWSAIYGDAELSRIRRTIRAGHQQMLATLHGWLAQANLPHGAHILDAGCGTGILAVTLAQQGYTVTAVDIAPHMVHAATERAAAAGVAEQISFYTDDLEHIGGQYDAVICLDVLIHYPPELFTPMLHHLASLSRGPLYFTHAPYNHLLAALHWLGGQFPQNHRRTTIQMIPDAHVTAALAGAGMRQQHVANISSGFYFVRLLGATPQS